MKRNAAADTEEMVADLGKRKQNQLTKVSQNSPDTVERRTISLSTDIAMMKDAVAGYTARQQLPMTDTDAVKEQILHYLDACAITGKPPIFMDICASLGRSRVSVYDWMRRHPEHETTQLLKVVQTQIASTLASQALQRNVSEVVSIFLLKNSGENVQLNDNYGIVAGTEQNEERRTAEEIVAKYVDLLDDDD